MRRKWLSLMLVLVVALVIPMSVANAYFPPNYMKSITGSGKLQVQIYAQTDAPPEMGPVMGYTYQVKNSSGTVVYTGYFGGGGIGSLNGLPYDTYTVYVTPNGWTEVVNIYLVFTP